MPKLRRWLRCYASREFFHAVQWIFKVACPSRMLPSGLETSVHGRSHLRCPAAEPIVMPGALVLDGGMFPRSTERNTPAADGRRPPVQTQNAAAIFYFSSTILIASISSSGAVTREMLDRSHLVRTFDEEFDLPVSFYNPLTGKGTWKTWYYWGDQNSYTSRVEGGTANIFSDQAYNGVDPFLQSNDLMAITAAVNAYPGKPRNHNLPYTSGVLTTENSFTQTYGYFEVRAALPVGQGLWPAFWMLSGSQKAKEEIDVMENLGQNSNTIYSTVHYLIKTPSIGKTFTIAIDNAENMHTYGVLWTATDLVFYVDDIEAASYANPGFHDPMYMLVCLQVGAGDSWPGPPNATTRLPSRMLIDHVRAYSIEP